MKNLKMIMVGLLGVAAISSCTQDELLQQDRTEMGASINNEVFTEISNVKLVSKRLLTESEIQGFANGNLPSEEHELLPAPYASSIPIYRYLYYSSYENLDHYYGTQKSTSLTIQGGYYSYERQEFNIMAKNNFPSLIALYRHYSSEERDHILSTASKINSYSSDGIIGYIFTTPQIGTVPLLEYYSAKRKSHLYVVRNTEIEWILEHDPDFSYVKIVGYVYPGSAIDEKKKATNFIITQGSVFGNPLFRLNIKVREGDKYWELSYEVEGPAKGTSVTIPINNTYTIISCIPIIETQIPYFKPFIDEITYPVETFSYIDWNIKKTIDNYNIKLEYSGQPPY